MGGVSIPRPLAESSCLDTGINPEAGSEMGEPRDSSVANAVVGA